jgi:hypothetical protein
MWRGGGGAAARGGREVPVADGPRFALIVDSHGLGSRPEDAKQLTTRPAADGFVVVAPMCPQTHKGAPVERAALPNRPADAWAEVDAVSRLDGGGGGSRSAARRRRRCSSTAASTPSCRTRPAAPPTPGCLGRRRS